MKPIVMTTGPGVITATATATATASTNCRLVSHIASLATRRIAVVRASTTRRFFIVIEMT